MYEGLSKISSNFTLHLIKDGKLKRFNKSLKGLESFEKGKACQSILITLREKIALSEPEEKKKRLCVKLYFT